MSGTSCSYKGPACTVGQVVHCTIQTLLEVVWPTVVQWDTLAHVCTAEFISGCPSPRCFLVFSSSCHLSPIPWGRTATQNSQTSYLAFCPSGPQHACWFRWGAPCPLTPPCSSSPRTLLPHPPPLVHPPSPDLQIHWRPSPPSGLRLLQLLPSPRRGLYPSTVSPAALQFPRQ